MEKLQQQKQSLVIFTDLDGTLLDHHSYSWSAALPALERARELNIPVIPCTSKTRAETAGIVEALQLGTPYIFENGSGYASTSGELTQLAPSYFEQLAKLEQLQSDSRFEFCGFSAMSVADIARATGLPDELAEKAKAREFSEPLLWLGSPEHLAVFKQAAAELNLNIISGGRFFHALEKGVSKYNALEHLMEQLQLAGSHVISLGDGDNDIPMLEAADTAVIINNPTKAFPVVTSANPTYYTSAFGPEGWNSAILTLLEDHHG